MADLPAPVGLLLVALHELDPFFFFLFWHSISPLLSFFPCITPLFCSEGRRGGGLVSHFLVAVAEAVPKDAPPGTKPSRFLSFAKVGSGYSMRVLRQKNELLKPHWHKFDEKRYPPCGISSRVMLAMPGYRERPDLWIEPENSIIVQIKAAQITVTEKFALHRTLRFPRVVRFREDKAWHECMTVDDVQDIVNRTRAGSLSSGTLELYHLGEQPGRNGPKRTAARTIKAAVPQELKKSDIGHVNKR